MDSTSLNLLTRDGAVAVAFFPALKSEHYSELHDAVGDADTPSELRDAAQKLADKWGHRVEFP